MDKGPSTRRGSSASHSTTTSDSSSRKAASIYEIHDLYSALQELVNPSPAIEKRSRKGTGLSFDSSDSWTSGPDSPDVRSRPLQERKNGRVVRSASSITQRFSGAESHVELLKNQTRDKRVLVKTPEMKVKELTSQSIPSGRDSALGSPKLAVKKCNSDASRYRSKSSIEAPKTMAEKIRDQRLKFTRGIRRREMEDDASFIEEAKINNIDELVEWAKLDTGNAEGNKKKRKKEATRSKSAAEDSLRRIKPICSDSNLKSMEVTSRLDRWYERASAIALSKIDDDPESFESYSGSESDEEIKEGDTLKKVKSLDGIDFLGSFTPEDLLNKWMRQKKNSLMLDEIGRSGSETSVEPMTPDESDSSILSKDDVQLGRFSPKREQTSSPLVINRIIVSHPSTEENKKEMEDANLPNQPIFYIPNIKGDEETKATVIYHEEPVGNLLAVPSRPRSRSEISTGTSFDREYDTTRKEIEVTDNKRSKSFGAMIRRASLEGTVNHKHPTRLSRTASDCKASPRPRSLILGGGLKFNTNKNSGEDALTVRDKQNKEIDANANVYQKEKKHEKGIKLSKLPGKLKTFLSGKKV